MRSEENINNNNNNNNYCSICKIETDLLKSSDCGHIKCINCWNFIYNNCDMKCKVCNKDVSCFLSNHFNLNKNSINFWKESSVMLYCDLYDSLELLSRYENLVSSDEVRQKIEHLKTKYTTLHSKNLYGQCYIPKDCNKHANDIIFSKLNKKI